MQSIGPTKLLAFGLACLQHAAYGEHGEFLNERTRGMLSLMTENLGDNTNVAKSVNALAIPVVKKDARKIRPHKLPEKPICFVQDGGYSFDDCRNCLRQSSFSESVGGFPIAYKDKSAFVLVLHTHQTKEVVAEACLSTRLCQWLKLDIISDSQCEVVYKSETPTEHVVISPDKKATFDDEVYSDASDAFESAPTERVVVIPDEKTTVDGLVHHQASNSLEPTLTHLKCIGINYHTLDSSAHHVNGQYIRKLMKAMSEKLNVNSVIVHWLNLDATTGNQAFLLISSDVDIDEQLRELDILEMKLKDCYNGYEKYFDATPIGDQILMPTLPIALTQDHYSECVLAYHDELESCHACLGLAEIKPVEFTEISSLSNVIADDKRDLANCISTSRRKACARFVYIPNEVCEYHASTLKPSIHKFFGWMISNLKSLRSHHNPHPVVTYVHPHPTDTLVLAEYNSYSCLKCLLLLHDVYIISTKKSYVWMVKNQAGTGTCNCETIKRNSFHDLHFLNPVSTLKAGYHVFGFSEENRNRRLSFSEIKHFPNKLP
uniref:AlNc14C130G6924 protein n=1 Tax=Albugo laibachii Nc14 TaxID=890382 RepID=F0WK72_9STRA|nr:AlNc14C130G6924 [Albugo laibachii Nc14]|eukprot:CCA21675.1 AlNc14C130G6924 [Albugo laibachii Nc14]